MEEITRWYLFWEVKVSLWGSRPLYSTLIRSCWLSAPSVRAMEPRLEGYNTQHILNHIKDKHMNAYVLPAVMVNRKIDQVSLETATAYWATPSLTSSVKFNSVLSVCRFYPQSLSRHFFPDITHTAIRNEASKNSLAFRFSQTLAYSFFFLYQVLIATFRSHLFVFTQLNRVSVKWWRTSWYMEGFEREGMVKDKSLLFPLVSTISFKNQRKEDEKSSHLSIIHKPFTGMCFSWLTRL